MTRALGDTAAAIRAALAAEHLDGQPHGLTPKTLKAHLVVHELVEKQLLEDDPPEVGETLDALLARGLTRHEAVHRIGEVVARQAMGMLRSGAGLDRAAYLAALRKL